MRDAVVAALNHILEENALLPLGLANEQLPSRECSPDEVQGHRMRGDGLNLLFKARRNHGGSQNTDDSVTLPLSPSQSYCNNCSRKVSIAYRSHIAQRRPGAINSQQASTANEGIFESDAADDGTEFDREVTLESQSSDASAINAANPGNGTSSPAHHPVSRPISAIGPTAARSRQNSDEYGDETESAWNEIFDNCERAESDDTAPSSVGVLAVATQTGAQQRNRAEGSTDEPRPSSKPVSSASSFSCIRESSESFTDLTV
jgi:hypothetical protein